VKALSCFAFALLCAAPSLASVTVTSPLNGASVTSPFTLSATASACSSQSIASTGYSLDSGTTTIVKGSSISTSIATSTGSHILHVKSWGVSGASCTTNVSITVVKGTTTSVTVTSPVSGSTVSSPFSVAATGTLCSGQSITKMGYSLDSGTTTSYSGTALNTKVSATAGGHTLHVKSWGSGGAVCNKDIGITVAASTNVVVSSPLNGASVKTPFSLVASGTLCSGQAITTMGYSLDSSSTTVTKSGTSLTASVTTSAGSHTLHVKAWGNGVSCTANVGISATVAPPGPSIPSNAVATKLIQNLDKWTKAHDEGTSGTSSGAMSLVASPSISGSARKFETSYTKYGGERYNVGLAPDGASTNFVYDTQIYLASPSSDISNIEMDLNQVLSNGNTVIFGFQCDAWSKTWDYNENADTIANPDAHWLHSNQTCDPHKWSTDTWHHIQIQYSRDTTGNVTYKAVWFDGVEQDLNITVMSTFSLGWGKCLNSNFQIDGFTSTAGSSTVYLDNMTLYSW
jgi:hypothetical protein